MEIKQEEAAFRSRVTSRLQKCGFVLNIENTMSSGVPDVYFEMQQRARWLELKVTHGDKPLIRKEQRVWMHRHSRDGGFSGVLEFCLDKNVIQFYSAPLKQLTKSGRYLRLLDEPIFTCHWNDFKRDKIVSMLFL